MKTTLHTQSEQYSMKIHNVMFASLWCDTYDIFKCMKEHGVY